MESGNIFSSLFVIELIMIVVLLQYYYGYVIIDVIIIRDGTLKRQKVL